MDPFKHSGEVEPGSSAAIADQGKPNLVPTGVHSVHYG
jgi:hypothetical protein